MWQLHNIFDCNGYDLQWYLHQSWCIYGNRRKHCPFPSLRDNYSSRVYAASPKSRLPTTVIFAGLRVETSRRQLSLSLHSIAMNINKSVMTLMLEAVIPKDKAMIIHGSLLRMVIQESCCVFYTKLRYSCMIVVLKPADCIAAENEKIIGIKFYIAICISGH